MSTTPHGHRAEANEGVVLLHGLARTARSMRPMGNALATAGYIVVNWDYPSRSAEIETLGEQTITAALMDKRLDDCERIHFVTHSMGGILLRSCAARHPLPRLGRVVMLGPPNQGSEVVDRFGGWRLFSLVNGPAGRELGTRADSTPNRLGAVDFELGVIAGDRSINWINSWMIQGPDDGKVSVERTKVRGMKEHCVVHATHPMMMRNAEVIRLCVAFLKTGSFAK